MGLDFSSNQKDSISLKSVHRYFEHGRDSASRKTYEKQSLFTLYRWWDSNPYGNARGILLSGLQEHFLGAPFIALAGQMRRDPLGGSLSCFVVQIQNDVPVPFLLL